MKKLILIKSFHEVQDFCRLHYWQCGAPRACDDKQRVRRPSKPHAIEKRYHHNPKPNFFRPIAPNKK